MKSDLEGVDEVVTLPAENSLACMGPVVNASSYRYRVAGCLRSSGDQVPRSALVREAGSDRSAQVHGNHPEVEPPVVGLHTAVAQSGATLLRPDQPRDGVLDHGSVLPVRPYADRATDSLTPTLLYQRHNAPLQRPTTPPRCRRPRLPHRLDPVTQHRRAAAVREQDERGDRRPAAALRRPVPGVRATPRGQRGGRRHPGAAPVGRRLIRQVSSAGRKIGLVSTPDVPERRSAPGRLDCSRGDLHGGCRIRRLESRPS
jgi:hypothetical protein